MTIRWLHLSDTHFREDELWDRRATLKALIAKVRELKAKGLAPDMVFVTGDIAWSGKAKEYEQATRFFTELNNVLELDPKDRWFLVPGNHDVDRSRIKAAHRAITASLQDEATVEELLLRDPDSLRSLSARLEAYYNFASDFLGPARALQADRPWRTDVREFEGVSVGILQLNSAWIAEGGKADEANLLVGEAQVREALDATPDAFLRIALMHHPLRNLREFDANRIKARLSNSRGAAFLLRGHLHLNDTESQHSPDGHLLEVSAGTLYTDETNWPRGFHVGEVDLDKGEARLHLLRYSGEGSDFFAPDNLTYENAPNGVCKIKLPASYRLGGKKAKTAKTISEDQRLSFTARYRNAAAAYHGHARFIGFPNQATRPNARVSDLFVPLRMKPRLDKNETDSRTTAAIAQWLLGPPRQAPARIVVLGDPGSGKTTLSRFLVMLAAGAITMPSVEVIGEPLAIRIAFRDFVERQRENPSLSLLEYLELQAKIDLSLPVPKTFLKKAIEDGQAVLLLDGLDEVGSEENRETIRNVVTAFCSVYEKLPVLVTSRIAGYDDAPLQAQTTIGPHIEDMPEDRFRAVVSGFDHFVLERFDDYDLRTFIAHWYSVQEPNDPVARDLGIVDLITALNADERVRELARTPILATLIAMIHRVEANLPGERSKLYELCVRMLLETWPAQAKRPFSEIDPGLQRAYLESLAFAMQIDRAGSSSETVTISRSDLATKLVPILRKRDFANDPEEKVAGVIKRWIDHLERHSGILVEQSIGIYAFFHLSIMEYLAAEGMVRETGRDGAVTAITNDFLLPVWSEVYLLAVGSHAEDGDFLDGVYEGVAKLPGSRQWGFLLECLREEARFRPEQRETVLGQFAAKLLQTGPDPEFDLTLVDRIQRFSVRHGEAVRRWIEHRLEHATGDNLAATVAIALASDSKAVLERLMTRPDRAAAAGALLELWPGSKVGSWAAEEANAASALSWSERAPHDLSTLRGIAALQGLSEQVAAASLIAMSTRTLKSCADGGKILTQETWLPAHFKIEPGETALPTAPRNPRNPASPETAATQRFAGTLAHGFARAFGRDFARDFAASFSDSASKFARDFALLFADDFVYYFGLAYKTNASERQIIGTSNFVRGHVWDFVYRRLGGGFGYDFSIQVADSVSVHGRSLMPSRRADVSEGEALRAVQSLLAAVSGEAYIALETMARVRDDDETLGYLLLRLENRWLFEVWGGIDQRLPENPTPAQLALYFALGWAQSTTTWAWPDSERWRTLFAAGPGEHWLVRSQWHLCKLTDDPASKDDDAGLRDALRDGHGDESLPGYAARLSEVLGIEG